MYATTVIGILFVVYTLLVFTIMGWFTYAVTHKRRIELKFKLELTTWIIILVIAAIAFHVITYLKLPWVKWEIMSEVMTPKREFKIDIGNYKFHFPETPMKIKVNEPVRFSVTSQDVTYGFGVFRDDGTLVFQMQVLPGHVNKILWIFHKEGNYTVRSTEYSGPENWKMVLKDVILVTG